MRKSFLSKHPKNPSRNLRCGMTFNLQWYRESNMYQVLLVGMHCSFDKYAIGKVLRVTNADFINYSHTSIVTLADSLCTTWPITDSKQMGKITSVWRTPVKEMKQRKSYERCIRQMNPYWSINMHDVKCFDRWMRCTVHMNTQLRD